MMFQQTTLIFTVLLVNMISNVLWIVDAGMGTGVNGVLQNDLHRTPGAEEEEEALPASCLKARSLMTSRQGLFIPECNDDGTFKVKQCWRGMTEECWCSGPRGDRLQDKACLETRPTEHCDVFEDCLVFSPALTNSEALLILPLFFVLALCLLSVLTLMVIYSWWSLVCTATLLQNVLPWQSLFCSLRDLCHMGSTTATTSWRLLLLWIHIVSCALATVHAPVHKTITTSWRLLLLWFHIISCALATVHAPVREAMTFTWRLLLISVEITQEIVSVVVSLLSECVEPFLIFLEIMVHLVCLYFAGLLMIQVHQNPTLIFGALLLVLHYYTNAHPLRYITDLFLFYIFFALGVTSMNVWAIFFFIIVCLPDPRDLKYPFLYWVFSKFDFSVGKLFFLYRVFGAKTSYTFLASSKKEKGSFLSYIS
eukprot:TRINITY_DN3313_c2_g1_i2.p1 TRINITY_DN3313_c2_g1~~TRINITY_DN3313_c2_g1_i2.p1  ORF type:complete len:435 (+),score=20.29 TRINITY_DN3313_c2_g1_i2:35-1306(+)